MESTDNILPPKNEFLCVSPEKKVKKTIVFKSGDSYSQLNINLANLSWLHIVPNLGQKWKASNQLWKKSWHVSTPNPRKTPLGQLYYYLDQGTRSHKFRNETSVNSRDEKEIFYFFPSTARAPHLGRLVNIANFPFKDTYVFAFVSSFYVRLATWPLALCLSLLSGPCCHDPQYAITMKAIIPKGHDHNVENAKPRLISYTRVNPLLGRY